MPAATRNRSRSTAQGPSAKVETITPKYARDILENHHPVNRTFRPHRIPELVRDMLAGRFHLNGETIKFDREGNLKDGQHRFAAVVAADVPVKMFVVRGLEPEVMDTIDIGMKRTLGQVLTIHGYTDTNVLARTAGLIWRYENKKLPRTGSECDPSHEELLTYVAENQVELSEYISIGRALTRSVMVTAATLSAAYGILVQVDKVGAEMFFERLASGANLDAGDPILALRNRLYRDKQLPQRRRMNQFEILASIIKAWNYWRDGRQVNVIHYKISTEKFPQAV